MKRMWNAFKGDRPSVAVGTASIDSTPRSATSPRAGNWTNDSRRYAILGLVATLLLVAASCGSGDAGYTQDEVDEIVAEAVSAAVDAQDDLVSEAEAEARAEAAAKQASLVAAVDACTLSNSPHVTADEAGLVIEGEGEESRGVDVSEVVCVLEELDVPDSIVTRMSNTNSQMGIVEGNWDVYKAEWTYHPDNGLNIFVVVRD